MDDTPRYKPDDGEPPTPSEAELSAVLAESDADLAAKRIVPGEAVMRDLQDSLARLEAKGTAPRPAQGRVTGR